jgi:hypothetical protein
MKSLKVTMEASDLWWDKSFELMAVPQGPTITDFTACLEQIAGYSEITWVGIPRIAVQQIGSRQLLISLAGMINPDWKLHLLGFSDNVVDDLLCSAANYCEGIDSAVPIRAGQLYQPFLLSRSDYGKRGGYWGSLQLTSQARTNIEYIRDLIGESEL